MGWAQADLRFQSHAIAALPPTFGTCVSHAARRCRRESGAAFGCRRLWTDGPQQKCDTPPIGVQLACGDSFSALQRWHWWHLEASPHHSSSVAARCSAALLSTTRCGVTVTDGGDGDRLRRRQPEAAEATEATEATAATEATVDTEATEATAADSFSRRRVRRPGAHAAARRRDGGEPQARPQRRIPQPRQGHRRPDLRAVFHQPLRPG